MNNNDANITCLYKGMPALKLLCWWAFCICIKRSIYQFGNFDCKCPKAESRDLHRLEWKKVTKNRLVVKMAVFWTILHLVSFLCHFNKGWLWQRANSMYWISRISCFDLDFVHILIPIPYAALVIQYLKNWITITRPCDIIHGKGIINLSLRLCVSLLIKSLWS